MLFLQITNIIQPLKQTNTFFNLLTLFVFEKGDKILEKLNLHNE